MSRPLPLQRAQPANFDTVARVYRWAELFSFGPLLQRVRVHCLPQIQDTRSTLALGDGDGRFLAALLRQSPEAHAIAVDGSDSMLSLLRRRCSFAGARLSTRQADFRALPETLDLSRTDLVTTHFSLDCLSPVELERLAATLARRLPPGARWVVSDFAIPLQQPWRLLGTLTIRLLYLAFRLLTGLRTQSLPDVEAALERHGFRLLSRSQWLKGLLYSELWVLPTRPTAL